MARKLVEESELAAALARLPGWARDGKRIHKSWKRASFLEGLAFVNAVGAIAEELDHHPDIDIRWVNVTLALTTHDSGGITAHDLALAARIEALAAG